jgi:outer membrane protein assembly factor BamB
MAGMIIYNVTQEVKGNSTTSELVAMDKLTGEIKWRYDMDVAGWSPSSPVPVYTADGKGYIVQCDRNGDVALIDGATGVAVNTLALAVKGSDGKVTVQNNFEATPVVYNNTIVVASRSGNIFFIKIT